MINNRLRKTRKKPLSEINVVPYIDVMLVLLVIFMICAPLLSQGVNVTLPQAAAKVLSPKEAEPIIVSIDSSGNYYLNIADKPSDAISAEALATRVTATLALAKQNHQTRDVFVKGDRSVDYGKVVSAMVLLQQAGAETVGLMTQTPDSTSPSR